MKKIDTKDFGKELTKSVDKAKKYVTYLNNITNPHAKDFFLTYYSGLDKKGYDPQPMFTYFITYITTNFGFTIPETNENYKEFCQMADSDGSLAVDLGELTNFFNNYVNFDSKTLTGLKMAEGLSSGVVSQVGSQPSGKNVVRLRMEVLEDFDAKDKNYDEER
jgi:hypothetical protein